MTTRVSFPSRSGSNTDGALAEPTGSVGAGGKAPAIVLIQEWWGVNGHIEDLCGRFAAEGFLVLAPDLYHGAVTKDPSEAARLSNELDTLKAMDEIAGAAAFLKTHPRSNGKVGVVGFCLGGALAFASACHVEGLAAVAPFYGVPPAEKVDYARVTAPIIAHFAIHDDYASVAKAEAVKKQLEANGKSIELHTYDAQHAFVNDTRPEVYDAKNAALAWERTVTFFKQHLSG